MTCDSNDEIINTLYKNYYEDDKSKSIPCVQEEETIACNLMNFIYNDKMLLLPIPIIYRILNKYYLNPNSQNDEIVDFIIRYIEKNGNEASVLMPLLDYTKLKIDHCIKLFTKCSPFIDSSLILFKLLQVNFEQSKEISQTIQIQNEKINYLQEENKNLKDKINDLQDQLKIEKSFRLCKFCRKSVKETRKIIPVGQQWEIINITEGKLTFQGQTYLVKSSSTWDNIESHHPIHLFNGKTFSQNGLQWAPHKDFLNQPSFIQITFSFPIRASALYITSRWEGDQPIVFEIMGSNGNESFQLIEKFNVNDWHGNDEKKRFLFFNDKKFTSYKIVFYRTSQYNVVCAEINLGEIMD